MHFRIAQGDIMGKMAGILRSDGWRYDRMTGEYRKGGVTIEPTRPGWARSDAPGECFETRGDAMAKASRAPRAPLDDLGLFTVGCNHKDVELLVANLPWPTPSFNGGHRDVEMCQGCKAVRTITVNQSSREVAEWRRD